MLQRKQTPGKEDEPERTADRNLILLVLGTSLAAAILLFLTGASPQFMLELGAFLVVALILAWRGHLRAAGLFAPLTALIIVTRLIFANYGIRDTAILGLPAIIIAASLMNGRRGTLGFGFLSLVVVAARGVVDFMGLSPVKPGITNSLTDYIVVAAIIILTVALQLAVLERLRKSSQELRRELSERERAEEAWRISEERYRLISEISSDYVFTSLVDPDGGIHTDWIAGAFEPISGYTPEEFVARGGWRASLHPDDLAQDELDAQALAANQKVASELRVITKSGEIRWVRVFARPVWDEKENRLTGIHGAVQNITEQRMAQDALRESEERYRTFIAQSTEGIRRYDLAVPVPINLPEDEQLRLMVKHMFIAECNDAFAHMYGLESPTQLVGKHLADMHLEDDPANVAGLRDFIRSGYRVKDSESHEINYAGQERYYLVNTIGSVENGCLVRAWGVQRDITEQKLAELKILQMNDELEKRVVERTSQLEAANKELESFSYSVSHDLRAPLRSINGFSEILIRDFGEQIDPMGRNFLKRIVDSARDMSELVDSLLEFSRLGRNKLHSVPVNLSEMAVTILEKLEGAEPERNVKWQVAPDMQAFGDETLLRNMLENLLGNAWKYTSKTAEAQISFEAQLTEGPTIFFIKDNGAGFDMQYANKLFGTFQRLHRADEFPGHGIGLANVQRIIHRHGGKVWAYGEPGKGATFYFVLPAAP